jgi:hypothetical protein
MENLNFNDINNWNNIKKLYLSNDKESWHLADTILQQADQSTYGNQIAAILKVIPQGRSELTTPETWVALIKAEMQKGNDKNVQMLADIYGEYLKSVIFTDSAFENFTIKLIYNGR